MKRLTRWMVRKFMPECMLIRKKNTFEQWREFDAPILAEYGYHIAKNPAKGPDRKKRQTIPEIPT